MTAARENKETLRDHQRQAAAGGVSVEGQDERAARRIAVSLKPGDRLVTVELKGCDVSEGERIEFVEAAALVESEARERERQAKLDGLGEMVAHYERERAVLVEALKESDDMLRGWIAATLGDNGLGGLALSTETILREHAALAGVVEAEPLRFPPPKVTGRGTAKIESVEPEAEPDGSERA